MMYTLRDESAAQPERSRRPHNLGYQTKLKERTRTSGVCLESAFPLPGPAATMIALPALRVAGAAALGGAFWGGSGHSLPEEQPARRKRRNGLVVVKSVKTLKYNQCVSCEHS